jgi:mannose-6-phosphate isomerase-like protein (cupin superfamily)
MMTTDPIILTDALAAFDQLWSPRIVARINDYDVRVAKIKGEFVWHSHADTDELFMVLEGTIDIALREGPDAERSVRLQTGSLFVVPKGTEHRPSSEEGASILLLEPAGTLNVGDHHEHVPAHITATAGDDVTAPASR